MLFEELSDVQRDMLLEVSKKIVFDGIIPFESELVTEWMNIFGYNDPSRKMLMASTAFPQRAMMSLLINK